MDNSISINNKPNTSNNSTNKYVVVGEYVLTKKIGSGSFASVFKAHHKDTHELYAIKAIDMKKLSKKLLDSLSIEIDILRKTEHVNIAMEVMDDI